jgi:hypothetical protein
MNWTTIYITGRPNFQAEVRKKLGNTDLDFMPGYIDNTTTNIKHDLYWLSDQTTMREMKEAIGSTLVWKYRLKFFTDLEAFLNSQEQTIKTAEFTKDDLDLMAYMREVA